MPMGRPHRRLFVPEVVQTSATDCGPAALASFLGGYGIHVSYGRLREACQTSVDGTSIDTMEELAVRFGLEAAQILVPVDHVLPRESAPLPAIAVVVQPTGLTHFVVVWRRAGRFVQVMDPGVGRRWMAVDAFLPTLYLHHARIPAAQWRDWAMSETFLLGLRGRAARCGIAAHDLQRTLDRAADDSDWRGLATVDAAVRMVNSLARSKGIGGRAQAAALLDRLYLRARESPEFIPSVYWTVRSAEASADVPQVIVAGAVLLHGARRTQEAAKPLDRLPPELEAAVREAPLKPSRHLVRTLRADGMFAPAALGIASALAAAGVVFEAIVLRNALDVGRHLVTGGQRVGAVVALVALAATLTALEVPLAAGLLAMGRRLEMRLRLAFLERIPLLSDRYFHSRPSSDMAERSHSTHNVRLLPELAGRMLRASVQLLVTASAIAALYPGTIVPAILGAVVPLAVAFLVQPAVAERDLRFRVHSGALAQFHLDALRGVTALRAHSAERALQREHESVLAEWVRSGHRLRYATIATESIQLATSFAIAIWLVWSHALDGGDAGSLLLLAYWAMSMPLLGQDVAQQALQYPMHRNATLRLLEPLNAVDRLPTGAMETKLPQPQTSSAVDISFRDVSVTAGGHPVLEGIDLDLQAGTHVAIVGASGAGKSSLVGLLLGWHKPSKGSVLVDGEALDERRLALLRTRAAWVEPGVWLWNRSLLDNVCYGWRGDTTAGLGAVVEEAELIAVLDNLPAGLQSSLGDAGGRLSAGEAQRVRFARALGRPGADLVILDEAFRGLDRSSRSDLLSRARRHWRNATMLCVTHDISDAVGFDRVIAMRNGRVVEYGAPRALLADSSSQLNALLHAVHREGNVSRTEWRRVQLTGGRLVEPPEEVEG